MRGDTIGDQPSKAGCDLLRACAIRVRRLQYRGTQHSVLRNSSVQCCFFGETGCPHPTEVHWNGEACPWESTRDNKIESTDRQIDTLVYELYGLFPDEIKIVVGKEEGESPG